MTNLMRTTKPNFNRRALATQAMQAAITTRAKAKLDQHGAAAHPPLGASPVAAARL